MSQTTSTHPEIVATKKAATIRKATSADLPAIRQLLSLRDQRQWDQDSTDWFMCGLDPDRCLAWLAFAGDEPVGLTSMYVRALNVNGNSRRVGYWANLFVHPDYRDQMLYPRLPMAMNQGLKPAGLDFLYACVRLRDVAQTHLRIGFGFIGRFNVLAKPLRPGRLIAKHKNWGRAAELLAGPLDVIYRSGLAARRPRSRQQINVKQESPDADAAAQVLATMLNQSSRDSIAQQWAANDIKLRFNRTREGGRYVLLQSQRQNQITAIVLYRLAERGNSITAGVIMAAAALPNHQADLMPAMIEAERRTIAAGGEVMLFFDDGQSSRSALMHSLGYRKSPETYDLLMWPKAKLTSEPELADLNRWRFSFADHDAF